MGELAELPSILDSLFFPVQYTSAYTGVDGGEWWGAKR